MNGTYGLAGQQAQLVIGRRILGLALLRSDKELMSQKIVIAIVAGRVSTWLLRLLRSAGGYPFLLDFESDTLS